MKKDDEAILYEFLIRGYITPHWYDWCEDSVIEYLPCGDTRVFLKVIDQSALYGVLNQIQDSGMKLISLKQTDEVEGV